MRNLLLLLVLASPASALQVDLDAPQVEVDARQAFTYALTVTNDGALPRSYSIEVDPPAGFDAQAPDELALGPGEAATLDVVVRARANAVAGSGFLLVHVTEAGLPGFPDKTVTRQSTLVLTETYSDRITGPLQSAMPWIMGVLSVGLAATGVVLFARQGVKFQGAARVAAPAGAHTQVPVQIATRGARAQHLHLHAENVPPGWKVTVEPDELDLAAGAATTVNVELDVPPWAFQPAFVRLEADGARRSKTVFVVTPE